MIRWPWVSRAKYEGLQGAYLKLLDGYKALSRAAVQPEPQRLIVPAVAPEPQPPSEIDTVIREQAEGDVELAKHLRRYAQKLRREGLHSPEIVKKLTQWTTTEKLAQME